MRRVIKLILGALLLYWISSCTTNDVRRVLVIHSYEDSYRGYSDLNAAIVREFERKGIEVDMRVYYLDCESYDSGGELKRITTILNTLGTWAPEIILVDDDQATFSLLSSKHPLTKKIPIVFAGVNYPNWDVLKSYSNVTGFEDKIDILSNIEMAKAIFGEKVGMFTILDSTYLDKKIRADIIEQVQGRKVTGFMYPEIPAAEVQRLCTEEDYTQLSALRVRAGGAGGKNGLLWSLSKFYKEKCYIQLKRDFTTINIGRVCSSPSLTAINGAFGYGERLLGGYMTTVPIQVSEQVGVAIRLLNGEKVSDIPITRSKKKFVVDWNVMKSMNVSKAQIPVQYEIINMPLKDRYPIIWTSLMVLVAMILTLMLGSIIILLRRERQRKRLALYTLGMEKEALELALDSGNTFVWRYENGYLEFEKAFWEFLGVSPVRQTLDDLLLFIHPDHHYDTRQDWDEFAVTKKKIVQRLCDFDGNGYQWWEFRYNTVNQPMTGYKTVGLVQNVQAVKDREKELEEARMLAEKAELKQSFLANMSHEIRTPLNSIVGFSNILASGEEISTEEKQEYISTINKNTELLLKLVNDILELSRMESGYMSFQYERCDVAELINDVYLTHQMLVPATIDFRKEIEPDEKLEVNVDRVRLIQVLTNFINNSTKFTTDGYIELGLLFVPEAMQVRIYVEDTGRGIPTDEQKMIFSRFYKQSEFTQGAGLGLSICKVIIEKLGGSIELISEPGRGSRFTVILPCTVIS